MEEVKNVVANENFAYDKTLSNVNVGEVVEGTVTGVNKR